MIQQPSECHSSLTCFCSKAPRAPRDIRISNATASLGIHYNTDPSCKFYEIPEVFMPPFETRH